LELAPENIDAVDAPAFAWALVIAGHSPAKPNVGVHSAAQDKRVTRRELHHTRNEAFRIAAPSLTTRYWTAPMSADGSVIAACDEAAASIEDVLECIAAVSAHLQHATVKTQLRILAWRFKIKVVPERQLRDVPFENTDIRRIEPFVADYRRIINERGIRGCIGGRHRHPRIRSDP
jgi:hypothetical protein